MGGDADACGHMVVVVEASHSCIAALRDVWVMPCRVFAGLRLARFANHRARDSGEVSDKWGGRAGNVTAACDGCPASEAQHVLLACGMDEPQPAWNNMLVFLLILLS